MEHNTARTILLGLSENPDREMKRAALEAVLAEKAAPPATRTITVPFQGGARVATLSVPVDLTPDEWGYMLDVLAVMRTGLVQPPVALDGDTTEEA